MENSSQTPREKGKAARLRVAEIFYSLQGEGKYIGTPSIFLRLFGCNMMCRGYGLPRGQLSEEYLHVDPTKYEKYEDLPLVHTGCDSYASWDPRFAKFSRDLTMNEIIDEILSLLPEQQNSYNGIHLIITGGEPMLWQARIPELLNEMESRNMGLNYLTFETNGTVKLIPAMKDWLQYNEWVEVTFSVSSKLPSSGEPWEKAIKPLIVEEYGKYGSVYFKWVISNEDDVKDIKRAIAEYGKVMNPDVYLMPAGGTHKLYDTNEKWVAKLAMELGVRFSPRLQVNLWANKWGT